MKETQSQTKSKVKVSPKLAVGVILVCIGAGLGAVAFNALVPTILTPTNNTSTTAQTSSNWVLVFNETLRSQQDYDNLVNAISNGAEVRVKYGQALVYDCIMVTGEKTRTFVECFKPVLIHNRDVNKRLETSGKFITKSPKYGNTYGKSNEEIISVTTDANGNITVTKELLTDKFASWYVKY